MIVNFDQSNSNVYRSFPNPVRYFIGILCGYFILLCGSVDPANAAVVNCQADRPNAGNVIYLYYPTASDSNFPNDIGGIGETTSPLAPFDVSDLDSGIGTTAELRSAITERVKIDYCEFDMRVIQTTSDNGTTNPTPSDPRWQVVGIGSDGNNGLFGIADDVDIGDNELTDFARGGQIVSVINSAALVKPSAAQIRRSRDGQMRSPVRFLMRPGTITAWHTTTPHRDLRKTLRTTTCWQQEQPV